MRALRTAVVPVLALALAACATASTSTPSSDQSIIDGKAPTGLKIEDQSIIDGKAPTGLKIEDHYAATYLDKPNHKAFAVATGSFPEQDGFASGLSSGHSSPQGAMTAAMVSCNKAKARFDIDEECLFYAINDTVVWGMSVEHLGAVVDSY